MAHFNRFQRPWSRSQSGLLLAIVCSSLAIGAPALSLDAPDTLAQSAETSIKLPRPAASVIQAIRRDLRQQFGVQNLRVVTASEQMWPDGCLGLPRGKEGCTLAIVPGWQVQVTDGLQTWMYRTDKTGRTLRLENPNRAVLPTAIAQRLIQQVARETASPASQLRVVEIKPQTFNGCMGIYTGPNQGCTRIAIEGWQAIVSSPNYTFVYHLSQDAQRIVRNDTASGATEKIRVSFSLFGVEQPPQLDRNVVFSSSLSGDLAGRTIRTELTEDGKVTVYQSSPTARFRPVVRKTLSPAQVRAFKQVLEDQRFPNFNGLSYLTSAALADYPTTSYQSQLGFMQLIDLEKQSLPRSLRRLNTSWEALVQP
jgi:hypothetical protein